jgi:hypothetical protein
MCAEGERIERPQGSRPDLRLATGCLTSSASLPYAGRDLHPHAPSGTRASGARASAFRHQRLEWPARFELALRPWQGRVLPLTLRPHGASGEIRTHDLRLTEAALCPLELQRQRSGSRTSTCGHRFQGPAGDASNPPPEWSRLPVPTRVSCLTGAGSQPCATAGHRRKRWRSLSLRGQKAVSVLAPVPPPIGLRGRGAATRCRPGPSAVRRRSRSRARRRELPSEDSNLDSLIQGQEACHWPTGH